MSVNHSSYLDIFLDVLYISDLCPAGTFLTDNKTYCMPCEGNTISTEGSSSCTPCETGTVANRERTECGNYKFIQMTVSKKTFEV